MSFAGLSVGERGAGVTSTVPSAERAVDVDPSSSSKSLKSVKSTVRADSLMSSSVGLTHRPVANDSLRAVRYSA